MNRAKRPAAGAFATTGKSMGETANMRTAGTLYGIGVGPGAPDLITVRAVEVLRSVSVIFTAASPKNDDSLALSIALPHLPPAADVVRLDFPMTREQSVLQAAWTANAAAVAGTLRSGRHAAVLTLGDPLIYSTFGYLMRALLASDPALDIRIIPGITSFQEAAAKTRTVLCEGEENFSLLSGINDARRLRRELDHAGSAVVMKAYRNFSEIRRVLQEADRAKNAILVSRVGLEGENIQPLAECSAHTPPYLSLLLAPPTRNSEG